MHGSTLAYFTQTAKSDEARWGTDFELWVGSVQLGWFRFAIQAKKLNLTDDRYSSFKHSNSHGQQIDLLERFAQLNHAASLYSLYNFTQNANVRRHYHCCDGTPELKDLGCSITPSSNIRTAMNNWGAKNFNSIHVKKNTLPWRCLVSCPKAQRSLRLLSDDPNAAPVLEPFPLFDPRSCYHRTLPRVLHKDSGALPMEASEAGGILMSIPLDGEREVYDPAGRIELATRLEFRERYHRDAGIPKVATVLEVLPPTQTG